MPDQTVEAIRKKTAGGDKALPEFECVIHDRAGELVARVHKTIYVRLKPRYRPVSDAGDAER